MTNTALISPTPKLQFFSANGDPLVNAKLYTYAAGTNTPLATYTDSTGATANANPVRTDSRGECSVWLGTSLYKFVLYTASDALVWTVDNIGGAVTAASITPLGLDTVAAFEAYSVAPAVTAVTVNGYYAAGDGGAGLYIRTGTVGPGAGMVQSDDGQWWILADGQTYKPEMFGAIPDGTTDNITAFRAALDYIPDGGDLLLTPGSNYAIGGSLVLEKTLNIKGGSFHNTFISCLSSGTYTQIASEAAAIIVLGAATVLPPFSGDAVNSSFNGFTLKPATVSPTNMRGFVSCAVVSPSTFVVQNFSSDGICILSTVAGDAYALAGCPVGSANDSCLESCQSISNGGHGFYCWGSNSNMSGFSRCISFQNSGWGFYDDSLLGNVYIATNADSNTLGDYYSESTTPCAPVYIGEYSETGTAAAYSLNPRSTRIPVTKNALLSTVAGLALSGLPSGDGYSTQAMTFAASNAIANVEGLAPSAGAFMRVAKEGLLYRPAAGMLPLKINQLASVNYIDLLIDATSVIRFPQSAVTGNLNATRPWFPQGASLGSPDGLLTFGSAAPGSGFYAAGAIVFNVAPASGQPICWSCSVGGTPGTWIPGPNYP